MNIRFFCFSLLLIFCVGGLVTPACAGLRGDIDGNGKVNLSDAVFILGWINSSRSSDTTIVKNEALLLYPVSTNPTRVPDISNDDLDGNGKVNLSDVVFLLGWINAGRVFDSTNITAEALLLYPVSTALSGFPGLENGSATIPITIEGITSN